MQAGEEQSFLMGYSSWFPMLLLIGIWIFFMRQMQGGGRTARFRSARAARAVMDENNNTVTFADVAGCEAGRGAELVEFLRDPSKFQNWAGAFRKTCWWSVRQAPAGRCSPARSPVKPVRSCSIFSSDFVEMFVGVGAAECAICSSRRRSNAVSSSSMRSTRWAASAAGLGSGNDEREQR